MRERDSANGALQATFGGATRRKDFPAPHQQEGNFFTHFYGTK